MHLCFKWGVRLLSVVLIFALIFSTLIVMADSAANDDSSKSNSPRIGLWWWNSADAYNLPLRDKYLNFYENMGVTEIYFYDTSRLKSSDAARSTLHTFIEAANAHGMRVALLYDNINVCNEGDSNIQKLQDAYLRYCEMFPDDDIYGFHFDIEGFSSFQDYCTNFIGTSYKLLTSKGIPVGVDVNCAWDRTPVSYDNVDGFYQILATHIDYMTLMSYRTTAESILDFGKKAFEICKQYNCDCLYGAEGGDSKEGSSIDFSGKDIGYMLQEVHKVIDSLTSQNLQIEYGIALHHASALYNLRGCLPGPYVNASDYDPEWSTDEELNSSVLYEANDLNISGELDESGNAFHLTTPEIAQALHRDFEENGVIHGYMGEYYKITLGVYSTHNITINACLYDATNGYEFWKGTTGDYHNDSINCDVKRRTFTEISTIIHDVYNAKESRYGEFSSDLDGILLYGVGNDSTCSISSVKIEVVRLENAGTSEEDVLLGDSYTDGIIDMKDVLCIRKYLARMETGSVFSLSNSDVNQDATVDMKDVLFLRKLIAKSGESA